MYFHTNLFKFIIFCSFLTIPITFNQLSAENSFITETKLKVSSNEANSPKPEDVAERSHKGYRDGLRYRGYQRNYNDRYDRYDKHDRYEKYYDRYDRSFDRYGRYGGGLGLGIGIGGLGIGFNVGAYDYPYYYRTSYPYQRNVYQYPDYSSYFDEYYYPYPADTIYYYAP
ncbi:MAG TPA: hypothetical protein VGP47_08105 [Parachlamydiaceae bacterium]|nr:hypothetical protein [Parachlamydiaceae bacterium]